MKRVPIVAAVCLLASCAEPLPPTPSTPPPPPPPLASAAPSASASAAPSSAPYAGLGLPPEVVEKYAPAPLPPEVTARIQAMLDVRAPGAGLPSPDGKRLFFTWSVTGTVQVFRLDGPGSFPVQLTGGEDTTRVVDVTPDGKTLVIQRDRRGEENPGLYLQSAEGGALTLIQHKPKVQTAHQLVTRDGKSLFYTANDVKPASYAVYRYDLDKRTAERVFDEDGLWSVDDERDGHLLLAKHVGSNMAEYVDYDLAAKKQTALFGQGEREDYVARYGKAAGDVLVLTPKLGEWRRLYRFHDGKLDPVTPEGKHDVDEFSIDKGRQRILYQTNEGGYFRVHALDAGTFKELALPKLPDAEQQTWSSTDPSGRYSTLALETSTSPATSWVLDWKTKKLAKWHSPSSPELDTSTFAKATLESYPARDGTAIPMFVRRPKVCAAPCPVLVVFHGGPEGQSIPGFNAMAQLFVDAGYVYVEPNVRGSEGYGKTWIHADDGPKRLQVITDIEDASRFIRSTWAKDGKAPKVAVLGGSYGGYSTLTAMTMFAGAYDAGVSIVGISNLVTFLENTAPYRRALRISEYGDPEKDREALVKLSPMTYVDRVNAPLLVVQGATDPRVPAGEGLQMFEAVQKKGVPTSFILFPDEGHGVVKRQNRVMWLGHAIAFLDQHLLGKAPSAAK